MKRASLSIFAVLSLLLTQLQPIVFGQSTRGLLPATETTRLNEPASDAGDKPQPGNRAPHTASPPDPAAHKTSPASPPAQTASPADPAVEKVRHSVEKTGMAQKITVFLKNGDALHGAVTKIERDEFAIAEVDFQRIFTIQYKDVKKTRSGYGEINLLSGKRVNPPKGAKIAVHVGLLFLIIGLPVIILATAKD
ncbi:MAG: hypothetical protein AABO41_07815 [Acidobacteriota bacterium]